MAGEMSRPVERRRGGLDLDAGDLRRRSVAVAADEDQPPVPHDQSVDPGGLEPRDRQRGNRGAPSAPRMMVRSG